jgi:hypothetical protein
MHWNYRSKFTYQNLMWNRRVERGNTYAAIVTSKNVEIPHKNTFKPKPNYFKPEVRNPLTAEDQRRVQHWWRYQKGEH